ncbi:MAG TPA: penicillin-binding protein 2, partial [Geopsychrobacteraceae bacterium]
GNIYSEDGDLLATSLAYFELRWDATVATEELIRSEIDSLALLMSRFFGDASRSDHRRQLLEARRAGNRYYLIRRKVTYHELQEIRSWPVFRNGRYRGGLIALQSNKRNLPYGMLAHRTIGYARNEQGAQSVGLEASFNEQLAGRDGKRLMQRISGGTWMPLNDDNEIEPTNGLDLLTTVNVNIQDVSEKALLGALIRHDAQNGCVIVMEVKSGKIKAIANLGKMADGSYWERYNYAIGESAEPGSTFKLATMLALLEDDLVKLDDEVDIGNGKFRYYDRIMRDAEAHDHGVISVRHAFEISSNVGISKLAYEHYSRQPEKFVKHLKKAGILRQSGIRLPGEGIPFVREPGDLGWSAVSIPWMSVGYEVRLTALQLLTFYNAIANEGLRVAPYLVRELQAFGKTVSSFGPPEPDERICSRSIARQLKSLLEGVVESGTARNIRSDSYKIAGKTGTALIADQKNGYRNIYRASFVGYFPANDPVYSCIVVVNEPSRGVYYGSHVAAPVFREIADKTYANCLDLQEIGEADRQKE